MHQALGLALLLIGIVLLVLGFNPSDEFGSDVYRFFTGFLTSKGVWLLVWGIAAAISGFFVMARGSAAK